MKLFRRLGLSLAAFALLVPTAGASAATTVYASPSGSGSTCSTDQPCLLPDALAATPGGQFTVALEPGTYGSAVAPLQDIGSTASRSDTDIVAADPAQRPTIYAQSTSNNAFYAPYGSVSGFDLVVEPSANSYVGLYAGSIDHVSVRGSAFWGICSSLMISNSLCVNTYDGGPAVWYFIGGSSVGSPIPESATYTNVTAWATGASQWSDGLLAQSNSGIQTSITVRNSIFHGGAGAADIEASDNNTNSASTQVDVADSSYGTTLVSPGSTASSITEAGTGGNVTSALLTDPAGGDFTEQPNSPTVDKGDNSAVVGTTDLLGLARIAGSAVDMGAYELQPPVQPGTANQPATPVLTKLRQSTRRIKAAKTGAAFQSIANAKKKVNKRRGAKLTFSLSGEGTAWFRLFHRVKKHAKKIWKLVGHSESVAGASGANTLWFSGRWNKKKLPPGTYELRATPTVKGGTINQSTGNDPGTRNGPISKIVR